MHDLGDGEALSEHVTAVLGGTYSPLTELFLSNYPEPDSFYFMATVV